MSKADAFFQHAAHPGEQDLPSLLPGVKSSVEFPFPHVEAIYSESQDSRHEGNPLILALPRLPENRSELLEQLTVLPDYGNLDSLTRLQRVNRLPQFPRMFIPVPRVAQLAERISAQIVESYIGREPFTAEFGQRLQLNYKQGQTARSPHERETLLKNCIALSGIPGAGKSQAAAHACRFFPPIIHHREISLWQIPVIRVAMPYRARSEHVFAIRIIRAIANRFPIGRYAETYLMRKPHSIEWLVDVALQLLHQHCVGMLIVDDAHKGEDDYEEQTRLGRSKRTKNRATPLPRLMDLLFYAIDNFKLPLLLIATSELKVTLDETASGIRRLVGGGMLHWGGLDTHVRPGQPASDFDVFLTLALSRMVIAAPELTPVLRALLLYYTFALPDVIMSLLHDIQAYCVENGLKTFDLEVVHRVANDPAIEPLTSLCTDMHFVDTNPAARARIAQVRELAAAWKLNPATAHLPRDPNTRKTVNKGFADFRKQLKKRAGSSTLPSSRTPGGNQSGTSTMPSSRATAAGEPAAADAPSEPKWKRIGK